MFRDVIKTAVFALAQVGQQTPRAQLLHRQAEGLSARELYYRKLLASLGNAVDTRVADRSLFPYKRYLLRAAVHARFLQRSQHERSGIAGKRKRKS